MRNWVSTREQKTLSGYANDVIHDRLYFGDNDGGTSVIQAKDYRIFINAVGETTQNISSGASVTQTEADTSLEGRGGTIPNGESFVITAIGINLKLSNVQATEPFTNNAVTSINITPVYRVSPAPLVEAIMSQCTFELYRNSDERLERGNVSEYPCEFGQNVAAGGGGASVPVLGAGPAQAAYTINPFQYIESGGMRFRTLTVYQVLETLDDFYGVFKANREIDLVSTLLCGCIDFYLVGRLHDEITREQFVAGFVNN
jgi:hypothetical protein